MFGLSFKKILGIGVVVAIIFAASQYAPAYLTQYQFSDSVRQIVKFAAPSRKDIEAVRRDVVLKARELGLEINPKEIRIEKRGPSFTLELDYTWPINLRVYQHDLTFSISESGEVFER
jgi:hypothetical protein